MSDTRFIFQLASDGSAGPPEEIRVRLFLKRLARRHGLRVIWPEPAEHHVKCDPTKATKRPAVPAGK